MSIVRDSATRCAENCLKNAVDDFFRYGEGYTVINEAVKEGMASIVDILKNRAENNAKKGR